MKYIFYLFIILATAQAVPRISFDPSHVSMFDDETQEVSITLSEPVISPSSSVNFISITFHVKDTRLRIEDTQGNSIDGVRWESGELSNGGIPDKKNIILKTSRRTGPAVDNVVALDVNTHSEFYKGYNPKFRVDLKWTDVGSVWAVFVLTLFFCAFSICCYVRCWVPFSGPTYFQSTTPRYLSELDSEDDLIF